MVFSTDSVTIADHFEFRSSQRDTIVAKIGNRKIYLTITADGKLQVNSATCAIFIEPQAANSIEVGFSD